MDQSNEKLVELRQKDNASSICKTLYDDTQDPLSYTCDLIIKAGSEKQEYFCHRAILALSSDFLWDVLLTAKSGKTPVMIFPDITATIMKLILFYVYNGHVRIPLMKYGDFVEACQLLKLKLSTKNFERFDPNEVIEIEDSEEDDVRNEVTRVTHTDHVITVKKENIDTEKGDPSSQSNKDSNQIESQANSSIRNSILREEGETSSDDGDFVNQNNGYSTYSPKSNENRDELKRKIDDVAANDVSEDEYTDEPNTKQMKFLNKINIEKDTIDENSENINDENSPTNANVITEILEEFISGAI